MGGGIGIDRKGIFEVSDRQNCLKLLSVILHGVMLLFVIIIVIIIVVIVCFTRENMLYLHKLEFGMDSRFLEKMYFG